MAGTFQFAQSCVPDESLLGSGSSDAGGQFPPEVVAGLREHADSGAALDLCAHCNLCSYFPFIVTECFAEDLIANYASHAQPQLSR